METTARTILEEVLVNENKSPLEGGSYIVTAYRLIKEGGIKTNKIEAKIKDNHYLIKNIDTSTQKPSIDLAIIDADKPDKAEKRMYEEALKVAEQRAKDDGNTFLDLTSKAKNISKEEELYRNI